MVQYRIVRDQVIDDRSWTESQYLLLAQVRLPGEEWKNFTHPDRGGPTYDPGAEHMIHLDVRKIYPDAVQQGE